MYAKHTLNTARRDLTKDVLTFEICGGFLGFLLRLLLPLKKLADGFVGKVELHLQGCTTQTNASHC